MTLFRRTVATVEILGQVPWQVARNRETGFWIGVCHPLNLNASGDTWREFTESASEAMSLLFEDLLRTGELDAFLYQHGWRLGTPVAADVKRVRFEMPYSLSHASSTDALLAHA